MERRAISEEERKGHVGAMNGDDREFFVSLLKEVEVRCNGATREVKSSVDGLAAETRRMHQGYLRQPKLCMDEVDAKIKAKEDRQARSRRWVAGLIISAIIPAWGAVLISGLLLVMKWGGG